MKRYINICLIAILLIASFASSSVSAKNTKKTYRTYKVKPLEKKKNKIVYRQFLDTSVPYIGATQIHNLSVTGKGTYIVIIDSGINSSHPMFTDKIALEACFTVERSCPNGTNKQIGSGAATMIDWHGSHVAGIAAGKTSSIVGVAPDAKIIAINVFDKDDSSSEVSLSNALNWVYSISAKYNIAAVNMSLGTSRIYKSYCDSVSPQITTAIHKLYSVNVPVVVAAGNSYSLGMSNPACISKVISVAAISENGKITSFSNVSDLTTFAAPGFQITSAAAESQYRSASGTSMAAPHVAGVLALYRQHHPTHSIDLSVQNIKSISPFAVDPYSNLSVSSVNVSKLLDTNDTPVVTTTIPQSSTTIQLPDTPTIPTIPQLPSFKPYLNKVYSSNSSFFYIRYQDSFAPKDQVLQYVLDCSTKQFILPVNNFQTTHIVKIDYSPDFVSCYMYANMKDGTKSALSTSVFLVKG